MALQCISPVFQQQQVALQLFRMSRQSYCFLTDLFSMRFFNLFFWYELDPCHHNHLQQEVLKLTTCFEKNPLFSSCLEVSPRLH